jgi:hypothetical protein
VYEEARRLTRDLYASEDKLRAIADCVYNHVVGAIDFDAMYRFEQILHGLLDEVGIQDDGDLAEMIVRDAIVRAASDPDRHVSHVPFGITRAEEAAVAFDPGCPLCVLEAARPPEAEAPDHVEGECECCDMMAREWRVEHADALARAGLGPGLPARSAPS